MRVAGEIEVVDGDVAALAQVLEGYGAADSGCAAGYGGGFGGEEMMWHCCTCSGRWNVLGGFGEELGKFLEVLGDVGCNVNNCPRFIFGERCAE